MKYNSDKYDPNERPAERQMPKAGSVVWVKVLPEGSESYDTHDGRSKNGNDMIILKCEVLQGEDGEGYWLTDYLVDNEYAAQNIGRRFDSMGLAHKNCEVNAKLFVGRVGKVKIKHETYQGKTRAKIAYWLPREEGEKPPVDVPEAPAQMEVTVGRKVVVEDESGTWSGTVKEIRASANECEVEDSQGDIYTVDLKTVTVHPDDDLPF